MARDPNDRLGEAGSRIHVDALQETVSGLNQYLERVHYRYRVKYRGRRVKMTHLIGALGTWFLEVLDQDDQDRLFLRYSDLYDRRREKQPGAADYPKVAVPHPLEPPVRPRV